MVTVAKLSEGLLVESVFLLLFLEYTLIVVNSIPHSFASILNSQRIVAIILELCRVCILNGHRFLHAFSHFFESGSFDPEEPESHSIDVVLRRKDIVRIILIQDGEGDVLALF